MFPGGGAYYVGMGKELYEQVEFFRNSVDHCFNLLDSDIRQEVKNYILSAREVKIDINTCSSLVGLFVVEYSSCKDLNFIWPYS